MINSRYSFRRKCNEEVNEIELDDMRMLGEAGLKFAKEAELGYKGIKRFWKLSTKAEPGSYDQVDDFLSVEGLAERSLDKYEEYMVDVLDEFEDKYGLHPVKGITFSNKFIEDQISDSFEEIKRELDRLKRKSNEATNTQMEVTHPWVAMDIIYSSSNLMSYFREIEKGTDKIVDSLGVELP